MQKIFNKGHRIRASDKHLVYHFSIGTLLFVFVAVLLLLNIKQLIPQRKRQSPACPTSSVAWCRNSSPDSRDVWKNRNSIRKISLTSVWSFKRHKKQGRHSERLTDQRQRELPVPMSDQPQLQSRVRKKCRKSNVLPQRPLQKQVSQSRRML